MKKQKILSLLLAVTMVLAMIPAFVVSTAAETTHIDLSAYEDGATAVDIGDGEGATYTVIKSAKTLNDLFVTNTGAGNYILGADIDYKKEGATFTSLHLSYGIFDGNGYAIYGYAVTTAYKGTFDLYSGAAQTGELTFRNLTIGQKDNPVFVNHNRQSAALIGHVAGTAKITVDSVTVYAINYTTEGGGNRGHAGFIGNLGNAPAEFSNCVFEGVLVAELLTKSQSSVKMSGFVGTSSNKGLTLSNCTSNTLIITDAAVLKGDFVGNTSVTVTDLGNNYANNVIIDCTTLGVKISDITDYSSKSNEAFVVALRQAQIDAAVELTEENTVSYKDGAFVKGTVATRMGTAVPVIDTETLKPDGDGATTFVQTQDAGEGLQNVRVLTLVEESEIANASSLTWSFKMMTSETEGYTLNVGADAISLYTSVLGGNCVYDTPEGYVLLAVEIEGVDSEWNGNITAVSLIAE